MADTVPAGDQPGPFPPTQHEGPAANDALRSVVDSSRALDAVMDDVRRSTSLARDFIRVHGHEGPAANNAPPRVIDRPRVLDVVDNARPEASLAGLCNLRNVAIVIAMCCMPVFIAILYMPTCFLSNRTGGLSTSLYCCADVAAICTLPGMGIVFRHCNSPRPDLHSANWEDYLELLGLSNDLISKLTDQLWDHSASTTAMARFAEKGVRRSDALAHADSEKYLRDASVTFADSTKNFTLEAFELLSSEWAVAKSTSAMHNQLLQALYRVHHPLLGRIPYLMLERKWMAAYMFEAARDALSISIQHLSHRYEKVLTVLETAVTDLGSLRDSAAEHCSPVHSKTALPMQPVEESVDDATSCRSVLRELDSARIAMATCAAPLLETWSWLDGLDSRVLQVNDKVRRRDRDVLPLGKADIAAVEKAVAEMEMVVGRMQRILIYQGFKGFASHPEL